MTIVLIRYWLLLPAVQNIVVNVFVLLPISCTALAFVQAADHAIIIVIVFSFQVDHAIVASCFCSFLGGALLPRLLASFSKPILCAS